MSVEGSGRSHSACMSEGGVLPSRDHGCVPRAGLGWRDVIIFLAYALVTLGMTYPLVTRLGTHVAGSGEDMWIYQWNNWWVRKVLMEGGDLYWTPYMFYPQGVSLTWHGFSWFNTAVWLPLQAVMGPLAAHNVTVLLTYVLSACTSYVLAYEVTGSRPAAAVAGLVFAFYPARHSRFNQLKLLTTQWLPLCALYLIRVTRRGRLRDGLAAGVSVALCALSGVQLFLFSGLWAALWLAYSLAAERGGWTRGTLRALALAALTCLLLSGPVLAPYVSAALSPRSGQDVDPTPVGEKSTDLLAYFIPSQHHPLSDAAGIASIYKQSVRGRVATVGCVALGLAAWAVFRRWRRARFWALSALVLALLALGSTLQIGGRQFPGLPLPYRALAPTLFGAALRNPYRLNLLLAVPVAVLVSIGLADLLDRVSSRPVRGRMVAAGVAALVIFEYLAVPFPTTLPVWSDFYALLREEPGQFAVADIPINFYLDDKWYMYAQTQHGRPMVGGHVSRFPAHAHDFIDSVPLLQAARVGPPEPGQLGDVSGQLTLLAQAGVRYVIVHKYRLGADEVELWREWFGLQPDYEDEYLLVYRTAPLSLEDLSPAGMAAGTALGGATVPAQVSAVWGTTEAPCQAGLAHLALLAPGGDEVEVRASE
jgi:hypothetical protein